VNIYTEPATTTPPTRCKCRHSLLHLFSSLDSALCSTGGIEVRHLVTLPVCWPSRRRTAATRRSGAPRPFMPLCPPSPCEAYVSEPAVEPRYVLQGTFGAPPRRSVTHLWVPDGCAEQAWRGRACASTAVATHCDVHSGPGRRSGEPRVKPLRRFVAPSQPHVIVLAVAER
jgi:hypothetical protein